MGFRIHVNLLELESEELGYRRKKADFIADPARRQQHPMPIGLCRFTDPQRQFIHSHSFRMRKAGPDWNKGGHGGKSWRKDIIPLGGSFVKEEPPECWEVTVHEQPISSIFHISQGISIEDDASRLSELNRMGGSSHLHKLQDAAWPSEAGGLWRSGLNLRRSRASWLAQESNPAPQAVRPRNHLRTVRSETPICLAISTRVATVAFSTNHAASSTVIGP